VSDRDWGKELSKFDKVLEKTSDEALFPTKTAATPAARAEATAKQAATSTWGVMLRLLLSTALGVGMLFWPYALCGLGLAGYLAAAGAVMVGGVWSAVWSWRHRAGRAHVLSLGLVLWGMALAAVQVAQRVEYGRPGQVMEAGTWACR
jgi:hypothetical protein